MKIRNATPADAPHIARLMEVVWQDEPAEPAHIACAIEGGNRTTLVAEENGHLLGFIDAFGTTFWELDLMAVDPAAQGKGIGKQLTYQALEAGRTAGFAVSRGLVAVSNDASQAVMHRMGLIPTEISTLYVFSGQPGESSASIAHPDVTPVLTFRYTGGWLNDPFTLETFQGAAALRPVQQWDVVGAVIPNDDTTAIAAAQSAGYERIGDYRWWTKAL